MAFSQHLYSKTKSWPPRDDNYRLQHDLSSGNVSFFMIDAKTLTSVFIKCVVDLIMKQYNCSFSFSGFGHRSRLNNTKGQGENTS